MTNHFILLLSFRLKYEQDRVLKRVQFLLTNFDGEVKTLRHDKSQYEVTLKNAELRFVLLLSIRSLLVSLGTINHLLLNVKLSVWRENL